MNPEMGSSEIQKVEKELIQSPRTWLVTGAAGFIGSHLCEKLLSLGQNVVGLDNFLTGSRANLDDFLRRVGSSSRRFRFIEGDICDLAKCKEAVTGVQVVLHQAALGSVPRSIQDPLSTHRNNADGTVNLLVAARDCGTPRFVFASSSSVYGDHPGLPKVEAQIGEVLSPYAASKRTCEIYAGVFRRSYKMDIVGLRYFNVFGPRQNAQSAYAAVIPRWIAELMRGDTVRIFGDGNTSRDFSFVANIVQANLLAASTSNASALGQIFNVAAGERTTLNQLFQLICEELQMELGSVKNPSPRHEGFRDGDVLHSLANVDQARSFLGYFPTHSVREGLRETVKWFVAQKA